MRTGKTSVKRGNFSLIYESYLKQGTFIPSVLRSFILYVITVIIVLLYAIRLYIDTRTGLCLPAEKRAYLNVFIPTEC